MESKVIKDVKEDPYKDECLLQPLKEGPISDSFQEKTKRVSDNNGVKNEDSMMDEIPLESSSMGPICYYSPNDHIMPPTTSNPVDGKMEEREGSGSVMKRDVHNAVLELPLFVHVKEEPNCESEGEADEDDFQSSDRAKHLFADTNKLLGKDKSIEMSDSGEGFLSPHGRGGQFDSFDHLREARQRLLMETRREGDVEGGLEESTGGKAERGENYARENHERSEGNERECKTESQNSSEQTRRKKPGSVLCEICAKSFPSPSLLENHRRIHTGERPFKCTECQKAFAEKSHLTVHMRVHSGEQPYKCTVCNKAFNQSGNFQKHMRIHREEKPVHCEQCGKRFSDKTDLNRHIRTHSGERPYTCALCGREFNQSGHLIVHMRIHREEKPFQCGLCKKAFSDKSSLNRHIRTHSGERPFACSDCGKRFSRSQHLSRHRLQH